MTTTTTTTVVRNANNFDADAVAVQDWLAELLVQEATLEVLPKLTKAQGALLRACLTEYAADPTAWLQTWDDVQAELYV